MALRVAFVQTPMATAVVPERQIFWRNFDIRYHAAHPGLRHMKKPLWELPHWIPWLAGSLVEEDFESIEAIDLTWCASGLATLDSASVLKHLARQPADVYLFSPMTPNLPLALGIADLVKQFNGESIIVFGGVVATPLYGHLAADPRVDYVVLGRGEIALPSLLNALKTNGDVSTVGNLVFKDPNGQVRETGWKYQQLASCDIPEPKIDIFPPETGECIRYLRQVHGLGCPYNCPFCTIQTIRQKQSFFPVERVLKEIHEYRSYYGQHHYIYFGDETFGLDKERTLELCRALQADGTISYDCQTRLKCLADADIRKGLSSSGCRWVEVGIETKSQSTQNIFKQRQNVATTEDILRRTRDDGLATCSFMVNGFPDQSLDDMKASVDWVCDLIQRDLLSASYFATLVPYPGSGLYNHPEKYGITIHHHEYELYNEDLPPVFDSQFASSEETFHVFQSGLTMIGQAMAGCASDSITPADTEMAYGQFWSTLHI